MSKTSVTVLTPSPTVLHKRIIMFAIVDLQGFNNESEFVAKEIAIQANSNNDKTTTTTTTISHWMFEPPYFWNRLKSCEHRQASWLAKNHHGLRWSDGYVPYSKLPGLLTSVLANIDFVIVKGAEKKTWMLQLLPDIIVEDVCDLYELTARKINNNSNNDNARNVEDDSGYDVDDDYCGIIPDVPNLKSMSSTNAIRCAFHNNGGVCALENVEKIRDYIRSVTQCKSYTLHLLYASYPETRILM